MADNKKKFFTWFDIFGIFWSLNSRCLPKELGSKPKHYEAILKGGWNLETFSNSSAVFKLLARHCIYITMCIIDTIIIYL